MSDSILGFEPTAPLLPTRYGALMSLLIVGLMLVVLAAELLGVARRRERRHRAYERVILELGEAVGRQRVLDDVRMLEHGQLKAHVLAVQQCIEQARTCPDDDDLQQSLDDASEQIHRLLNVVVRLHQSASDSALPDNVEQVLVEVTHSLAVASPSCTWDVEVVGRRWTPLSAELRRALIIGLYNGLMNAFLHASPSRCAVTLRYAPDAVILTISDDGSWAWCEFPGRGLSDSHRVAQGCGGTVTVEYESGVGTTFTMMLPLPEQRSPADQGAAYASLP
jgi:glucose-6-phosphate-specific signal transduction histidine kinase